MQRKEAAPLAIGAANKLDGGETSSLVDDTPVAADDAEATREETLALLAGLDDKAFALLALAVRPPGIDRLTYAECLRTGVFDADLSIRNIKAAELAADDPVLRRLLIRRSRARSGDGGV